MWRRICGMKEKCKILIHQIVYCIQVLIKALNLVTTKPLKITRKRSTQRRILIKHIGQVCNLWEKIKEVLVSLSNPSNPKQKTQKCGSLQV